MTNNDNPTHSKTIDLVVEYRRQKMEFLDQLQPDDFRNGESFNQAGDIIDQINQSLYSKMTSGVDIEEFIHKAMNGLLRQKSQALPKAINLAQSYIKMRTAQHGG